MFSKGLVRFVWQLGLLITISFPVIVYSSDDVSLSVLKDAAGMFNERGYLKSNSFSYDGEEVINDFNGNLMFVKTLEYIPLSQDGMNLELKLTYNGSVGHISPSGWRPEVPEHKKIAINMPEWILSVNNIAVQVFNFENEMVTWAGKWSESDSISKNEEVVALVNGYHYNYHYVYPGTDTSHGTFSILLGDGSVQELVSLENQSNNPSGKFNYKIYRGEYRSLSKDDRSKGYMYENGTFVLFREDGIKVTFRYYQPRWRNKVDGYIASMDSLAMFLPLSIEDSHSGLIELSYLHDWWNWQTGNLPFSCCDNKFYGRPPLLYIWEIMNDIQIKLDWDPMGGEGGVSLVKNDALRYQIFYSDVLLQGSYPGQCGNHNRAYVTKIKDAAGRATDLTYKLYRRNCLHTGWSIYSTIDECSGYTTEERYVGRKYDLTLQRLHTIKYPDGGQSFFSYYQDQQTRWGAPPGNMDTLSVDYHYGCTNPYQTPCTRSSKFTQSGRDPFYINMVTAARRVKIDGSDTTVISCDSLIFTWEDITEHGFSGYISENDTFKTTRYYGPSNPLADERKKRELTYKQFAERGPYSGDSRDRGWVLKLLKTEEVDLLYDGEKITVSEWDVDLFNPDNSTFQLLSSSITQDGITNTTDNDYLWNGQANDRKDVVLPI